MELALMDVEQQLVFLELLQCKNEKPSEKMVCMMATKKEKLVHVRLWCRLSG